jgi:acetyl-CoA carboxylase biotin carboxylase subunit
MTRLHKCLIANRGEIAVRIIRACQELGIVSVAVYSEADHTARHVRLADEAHLIGPATPYESYLNIAKLIAVAHESGCDSVHPGYGFLSENADFAAAVGEAGLLWIGPSPEAIRLMGVKTEARALMEKAGVPVVPGYQSDGADMTDFAQAAGRIGYPVMVKAAGGGGGKGIRIVYHREELEEAISTARREAQKAFDDPRVFLEKYIEAARHIEIQVVADQHGNTVQLFERECSAQRRHQKIIEESPAPRLTPAQRQQIGAAAIEAARAVAYVNAGTVEFIAAPDGAFYFLEMNTRLQVEHPVTELLTGVDLVRLQFQITAGEPLPFTQAEISQRGHAMECRLYAEDPANHFLPAVGRLLHFVQPEGPGIRVDSGVQSGDEITIHYDPLIAKIIVHAPDREAAVARMQRALEQTVILGTTTNLAFLRALLSHPVFLRGEVDTRFVDTHLDELLPAVEAPPDMALIAAALADYQASTTEVTSTAVRPQDYSPWSRRDGFRIGSE